MDVLLAAMRAQGAQLIDGIDGIGLAAKETEVKRSDRGFGVIARACKAGASVPLNTERSSQARHGNVQFNGLPALSNGYIVDGLETNDPLTNLNSGLSTNLVLGINSIAEVTVNTLSYSADQGRYGASQVKLRRRLRRPPPRERSAKPRAVF